ncbi:MAG: HAD-superfamily hydrolase, subfamily IIB [uncultured bacterium]|nr:MAG: HAD-superfamily hydrolase, subfamily IIB [uncultured bacterium]
MSQKLKKPLRLLACDLDCTVLPNGTEPLSLGAVPAFAAFVQRPDVHLVYASGRDIHLVQNVVTEFNIPLPDSLISDVGTTLYHRVNGQFIIDDSWSRVIASDWHGYTGNDIAQFINDIPNIRLQPPAKQNRFKLSYFTSVSIDHVQLISDVQQRLQAKGIKAAVIFSIDEVVRTGLLDILPAGATKRHAVDYLRTQLGLSIDQVVYAGDSGNDLEPLTSGYKSILVNNAAPAVKTEVRQLAKNRNVLDKIYFAHGGYQNMNGNYVAGILEGLEKFGWL